MRHILAAGWVLLLSACMLDTVTSRYANLEEARADRLFERGWLPDVLPPSTTQIRTSNELDLNLSEGEFSFNPGERELLFTKLSAGAPPDSRLADWDEIVSEFAGRGYSAWTYRDEGSTWAFFCQESKGYCEYHMWLR